MADPEGRVTLWGIEVFVAAAEEGSISAAAASRVTRMVKMPPVGIACTGSSMRPILARASSKCSCQIFLYFSRAFLVS